MQKKLIALAVAGLGALSGAAYADDSSLTLYGIVDAGIGSWSKAGPTGQTATGFQSGGNAPDIWGMKGSENLGNGTKVIFDLEGSMNMGTGSSVSANSNGNLFGREAYVGLDGDSWGTVKFGLQLDPYLIATLLTDAADLSESGSALNNLVFALGTTQLSNGLTGLFDPNAVSYQTPDIGGVFHATLLYGFGGVAGNTSASRYWSMNAVFHSGPFLADVAYFDYNDATGATQDKSFHIGGSYKFNEMFKLYASYDDSKTPGPGGLSETFALQPASINEVDQWGIGLGGNFTPTWSYSLGYYREEAKNDTADRTTTAALQLNYHMSKHTTLYGVLSQLKAGCVSGTSCAAGLVTGFAGFGPGGGPIVFPGNTMNAVVLGVTHTF
jgi:predicted porin